MKSSLFLALLMFSFMVEGQEERRFIKDDKAKTVGFFGEARRNGESSYEGVEKAAWAEAIQYLYQHYQEALAVIKVSAENGDLNATQLVKRLRSKNTVYFRDGVVRVYVEFSFDDLEREVNASVSPESQL